MIVTIKKKLNKTYSRCRSDREHLITRKRWKLRITNAEITYDDNNNQMMDICYPVTIQTDSVNQQQEPHTH